MHFSNHSKPLIFYKIILVAERRKDLFTLRIIRLLRVFYLKLLCLYNRFLEIHFLEIIRNH
jgi:hypothetical protein